MIAWLLGWLLLATATWVLLGRFGAGGIARTGICAAVFLVGIGLALLLLSRLADPPPSASRIITQEEMEKETGLTQEKLEEAADLVNR